MVAAPAVALPAIANAGPDPIFAALERHRAARAALERSLSAFNEAEARSLELRKQCPGTIPVLGPWSDFSSDTEIDKALGMLARDCWTPSERRALKVMASAAKRRLRRAQQEREAARVTCGFTAAEETQNALMSELVAAEQAVASTMPSTLAGAQALSEFTRELNRDGDIDVFDAALDALSAFLRSGGGVNT